MFSTIRKHLSGPAEDLPEVLLRSCRLLMQGLEMHTFKADEADFVRFQRSVQEVQAAWAKTPSPSDVLLSTGALLKAYEEYNHQVKAFVAMQAGELQNMVSLLTKAVTSVGQASDKSVNRLQIIERQLHKATMGEDYRDLKLRLQECLSNLQQEIEHQKVTAAEVAAMQPPPSAFSRSDAALDGDIPAALLPLAPPGDTGVDKVTGLPSRPIAEALLTACREQNRCAYAAVFVLERFALINARYGYAIGDELLAYLAEEMAHVFSRAEGMFRWCGPAVVGVMERKEPAADVRNEISRIITSRKLSKTAQSHGRTVLLPVALSWGFFPVLEEQSTRRLIARIDAVVSKAVSPGGIAM